MSSPSAARPTLPDRPGPGALGSAALLLVSLLAVYWPILHGGLLWDDDAHVTKAALQPLHGLFRIWFELGATQQYYPVLHSAFWVEHRLWGDSVLGYHLATLFFHGLAAWLLTRILNQLGVRAAWIVGLVFALHPVCVESVAWISEQKNTLSAVFYLASGATYLRFNRQRQSGWYALALGLFLLALLTKSVTATLPAAILVVLWWQRGRLVWTRDVVPLLPWFVVALVSGVFTAWTEVRYIGAAGSDFGLSALQRLLLAAHALLFYLGKDLLPVGMMFIYPRWIISAAAVSQWGFLLAVAALVWGLVWWTRRSRGPLAAFLFFAGTLVPALGFVNVYPFIFSFVADHFQYLASIGVMVPVICFLDRRLERPIASDRLRSGVLLVIPVVLGFLSWRACQPYRDADALNRTTIERNPAAWLAHYNLAVSLGKTPEHREEAIAHYREVIRLKPDHWSAHNNLASELLLEPGGQTEAVAEYRRALALNPQFAEAANDLGVALGRDPQRQAEAVASLRQAIALRPAYDAAHNNLGDELLKDAAQRPAAIAQFREAVRLAPTEALYHYDLANALVGSPGGLPEAITEYREAIRLRPDYMEAHSNLGSALAHRAGGMDEAAAEFAAAIKLAPNSADVHGAFANVLARDPKRFEQARTEFEAAIRLAPADPINRLNFAVMLAQRPIEQPRAIVELYEVLRLDPRSAAGHYVLAVLLMRTGGDRVIALDHLRQAVALQPDFQPAVTLLRRLGP